jgi:hypothetical protein
MALHDAKNQLLISGDMLLPAISTNAAETRVVEITDPEGFKRSQRYYRLATPGFSGE